MVMGPVIVGAIAANDPSVGLDDVTPIAELTTDRHTHHRNRRAP
jgi:hypothetical protein